MWWSYVPFPATVRWHLFAQRCVFVPSRFQVGQVGGQCFKYLVNRSYLIWVIASCMDVFGRFEVSTTKEVWNVRDSVFHVHETVRFVRAGALVCLF